MQTDAFQEALDELLKLAGRKVVTVMCAEAVPWRCHRGVLADAVVARGGEVLHIMTPAKADPHKVHGFARVRAGRVTYPSAQQRLDVGERPQQDRAARRDAEG